MDAVRRSGSCENANIHYARNARDAEEATCRTTASYWFVTTTWAGHEAGMQAGTCLPRRPKCEVSRELVAWRLFKEDLKRVFRLRLVLYLQILMEKLPSASRHASQQKWKSRHAM